MQLNQDHPSSNGIDGTIKIYDELYFNMNFQIDSEFIPLATATPTEENMIRYGSSKFWNIKAEQKLGEPQTLIWAKETKTHRAASFVGGHYHWNWAYDDLRKYILNTITWVSRIDVPENGVDSTSFTVEMLNENLNSPNHPDRVPMPTIIRPEIAPYTAV
ncbi:MAG: hypothetical protein AAF226_08135 [Verrucomicrobiota bacterium]